MNARLRVQQLARKRDIVVTDGAVSFNLDEDREFHAAGLCRDAHDLDAGTILRRLLDWLHEEAPMALIRIEGTIPPDHPLGVLAARPNGRPFD